MIPPGTVDTIVRGGGRDEGDRVAGGVGEGFL